VTRRKSFFLLLGGASAAGYSVFLGRTTAQAKKHVKKILSGQARSQTICEILCEEEEKCGEWRGAREYLAGPGDADRAVDAAAAKRGERLHW
jgi:hypothetical protein